MEHQHTSFTVEVEVEDDGEPFDEKMNRLAETLRMQTDESAKLDSAIAANLMELGYGR
jgi:type I restriction enzyme M protein